MSEVKIQKGTPDWNFQVDLWKFRQKYFGVEPSTPKYQEYWNNMAEDAGELRHKYEPDLGEYVKDSILACLKDFEMKGRELAKNEVEVER